MNTTMTATEALALARRTSVDPKHPVNTYTFDIIWTLYDRVMNLPSVDDPGRDRFFLSKGHGPGTYYAVLAAKNLIPVGWLDGIADVNSPLGGHPDGVRVPAVEISAGSLGHGLPLGVGTALGLRAQGFTESRVYVLIGDAEFDEGSNHEAVAYAGAVGLANLTVVVADNASASHGWAGGIGSRFAVHGWTTEDVSADDGDALYRGLTAHTDRAPHVVVARTAR